MAWGWVGAVSTAVVRVVGIGATLRSQRDGREQALALASETRAQDRKQAAYERVLLTAVKTTEFVGWADVIWERRACRVTDHGAGGTRRRAGVLDGPGPVPGSSFTFDDRGTHELRDVPGTWHLFAVTGVDGSRRVAPLPAQEAAARREAIEPPPRLERRSGRIGAIAPAVTPLAVVIAVPLATRGSSSGVANTRSDHHHPAGRSARQGRSGQGNGGDLPVGDHPAGVAFGERSVWVTKATDKTVSRVDPASGWIAAGEGFLWVSVNKQ